MIHSRPTITNMNASFYAVGDAGLRTTQFYKHRTNEQLQKKDSNRKCMRFIWTVPTGKKRCSETALLFKERSHELF